MRIAIVASLVVALAAGCAGSTSAPPGRAPAAAPVVDADLGLEKGSVLDTPTPPAVKANETAPGAKPGLPRAYAGAPPRIPHGVADFLPITAKENACVGCHAVKEKRKGEPTPLPPSHYTDTRNAPDRVGSAVVGARWECVSCHMPTTDAPDRVENRFR